MSVTLTIRDVPDDTRDLLAQEARRRGQSLQAYLLSLLQRQAAFSRNRVLLNDIEHDLAMGGGAGADAPDAAELLHEARQRHDVDPGQSPTAGAA